MVQFSRSWAATYRLQVSSSFTFDDVADIASYLSDLGISHVYLSPILQAQPGSTHGYDTTNPARISSDLGGDAGYERAMAALDEHGIGQVLDIVPNHMATSDRNPWWWDVLRKGVTSPYARCFDLRWQPVEQPPRSRAGDETRAWQPPSYIRLPVLTTDIVTAIQNGDLRLALRGNQYSSEPVLRYLETDFPLAAETIPRSDQLRQLNLDQQALLYLAEHQHYRLVHWRTAAHTIDYRRFFDINSLVGVRVEDEEVFLSSHRLLLELVSRGRVQGLRIDHVDGLRDPEGYLARLRRSAPDTRVLTEKILASREELPTRWPIDGTTGYDFLALVNGLFVEPTSEAELTRLYNEVTHVSRDYEVILEDSKRYVAQELFGGDISYVASLFRRVTNRWKQEDVESLLREIAVALPVYRTYLHPARGERSDTDLERLDDAIRSAGTRLPDRHDPLMLDAMREVLLGRRTGNAETDFVLSFQQLTGPIMAKGAEDTSFYVYNRLISLNEVGGEPGEFGAAPDWFHQAATINAEKWPLTMLTTSTHDTKQGEDTRLRINTLSELTADWEKTVKTWMSRHTPFLRGVQPDANARYRLYQAAVGAWPIGSVRMQDYMLKSAREAKTHTSWLHPDEAYEAALLSYTQRVMEEHNFARECEKLVAQLDRLARVYSLGQTLLKLTAPGVPDLYQGSELWEYALVDPDNRRPIDYEKRRRLLAEIPDLTTREIMERWEEGLPKLWLIWKTLALRNRRPGLFAGGYIPLYADGPLQDCLFAYRRDDLIVAVPRLIERIEGRTQTSLVLPPGRWRNALTDITLSGGPILLEHLLREFPVALLVREEALA